MKRLALIFCSVALFATPTVLWAMASAPGKEGGKGAAGGGLGLFAPMILVFVIFYLLLIRPQAKQQKKHRELLNSVKRGDEVVTVAGIYGRIASVVDTTVQLEITDNVRIKMDKQQIARVLTERTGETKPDKK